MVRSWRSRQVVILVFVAALLEPLGHQLAYLLHYGTAGAARLQSVGSHAYFPRLASFTVLTVGLGLAGALLLALGIRLTLGRRAVATPGFGRIFLVMAGVQCGLFVVQETVEAAVMQATPDFLIIAFLAVCAQLPIAGVAAFMISRIYGLLALAPEALRVILALQLRRPIQPIQLQPVSVPAFTPAGLDQRTHRRRGPPLPI
jgi:hypothetical protein